MSDAIRTPYFVVDEGLLRKNLELLKQVQEEAGCRILLAQKAFSMFYCYPLIASYLCGTTASGLYEARLGKEQFGGETHVFSPAYREDEFEELLTYADHFVFNSPNQLRKFGPRARAAGKSVGLRTNPRCSTQEGHAIYDPCAPFSRLGTTAEKFRAEMTETDLADLDGIHFHTLCEQNSDDLEVTLEAVEEKFGEYLGRMKWLNFGGGHHITRPDYDRERLKRCIRHVQETYGVQVYLEPGEAVALNAGILLTEVQEIVENGMKIAILDASAACHMPDVLEMPYRPPLKDAEPAGGEADAEITNTEINTETNIETNREKKNGRFIYRLAGPTCLAGDVIGDYSFTRPLEIGDRLEFQDMAIYTMVKTNTFNGMKLPDIVLEREDGAYEMVKTFGYEEFKTRL